MTRSSSAHELIDAESIVADTLEFIRSAGENPGGTEEQMVRRLHVACERIGAEVMTQEVAPGRHNLHAALGPAGAPSVLFLGHSDVVPAGEGWTTEPFEPQVIDGEIFGRGATDMKGGLAAVVAAMSAVAAVAPDVRTELLCTVDEEDMSRGIRAWLAAHPVADHLACIVAEPTDLEIVIGCRGATNLSIEVTGASAHAGRPSDGISSISAAARVVDLVRRLHDESTAADPDPLLGTATWSVGTIAGGSGTSMVPRATTLTIDRRMLPGEDASEILDALLAAARTEIDSSGMDRAESIELSGSVEMVMPGFRVDPSEPVCRIAATTLEELRGAATVAGWTAACEGGYIASSGTPTVVLGPGDITTQAHQPDEHVRAEDLVLAARAYTSIVLRLVDEMKEQ